MKKKPSMSITNQSFGKNSLSQLKKSTTFKDQTHESSSSEVNDDQIHELK